MDWWQTLIVATVPALITAVALVVQQRWSVNTELMRLEQLDKDRQHARDMANDERAAAAAAVSAEHTRSLQALWRDERRAAHENMIAALTRAVSEASGVVFLLVHFEFDGGDVMEETGRVSDAREPLNDLLAAVKLVASDEAGRSAEQALAAFLALARLTVVPTPRNVDKVRAEVGDSTHGEALADEAKEAAEEYLAAARRDMGAVD